MTNLRSPIISLPLNCLDQLPSQPGVYFLMRKEVCLYVGKSTDLKRRWCSWHHREYQIMQQYPDAQLSFVLFDRPLLKHWEDYYIDLLKPLLNKTEVVPDPRVKKRQKTRLRPEVWEESKRKSKIKCQEYERRALSLFPWLEGLPEFVEKDGVTYRLHSYYHFQSRYQLSEFERRGGLAPDSFDLLYYDWMDFYITIGCP